MEEVGRMYAENPAIAMGITDRGKIALGRKGCLLYTALAIPLRELALGIEFQGIAGVVMQGKIPHGPDTVLHIP